MFLTVNIHQEIYDRIVNMAQEQKRDVSILVAEALMTSLGLEGLPMSDIFGDGSTVNKKKSEGKT